MAVAAFVDAPELQRDLAIELAVTMAEFSIEENKPLYLLADAVAALEVGLSLLGSRESRTVEGGDYQVSPIQLLPFIPRPNSLDDRLLEDTSYEDAGGAISELYELGLFARDDERAMGWETGSDPAFALSQVISGVHPKQIVGLGEGSIFWKAISEGIQKSATEYAPQIIMIDGFGSDRVDGAFERVVVRSPDIVPIRRARPEFEREIDELESLRITARRDGALVAGFLDFLTKQARRDPDTPARTRRRS